MEPARSAELIKRLKDRTRDAIYRNAEPSASAPAQDVTGTASATHNPDLAEDGTPNDDVIVDLFAEVDEDVQATLYGTAD